MAKVKVWEKDKVALAYEKEILAAAKNGEEVISNEVYNIIEKLADEFDSLFNLENKDKNSTKEAFNNIRVNGREQHFFKDDIWEDDKAARAYAMLKIRETVLYSENKETADRQNHISIKIGENWEALEKNQPEIEKPVKPNEISGFKKFMNKVFNGYKNEVEDYNIRLARYRRDMEAYEKSQATKAYNEYSIDRVKSTATSPEERVVKKSLQELRKNNELNDRLKEADIKLHKNSKEYNNFLKALKDVNDKWDNKPTERNANDMLESYNKLEKSCRAYLEKNAAKRSTETGKKRVEIVRNVLEAMQDEKRAVEILWDEPKTAESFETLGSIASKAREIDIDNGDKTINKIGGMTSSRTIVEKEGEKFVFTADKTEKVIMPEDVIANAINKYKLSDNFREKFIYNSIGAFIDEDIKKISSPADLKKFLEENIISDRDNEALWNKFADDMYNKISDLRGGKGNYSSLFEFVKNYKLEDNEQSRNNNFEKFKAGKDALEKCIKGAAFLESVTSVKENNRMQKLNSILDAGISLENESMQEVAKFIDDITAGINGFLVAGSAGIKKERRNFLNERNIATSEVADLLNCSDTVAKSVRANKTEKGEKISGMAMEFVDGLSCDKLLSDEGSKIRKLTALEDNGDLKKKIADLQLLDCICGQIDRHMRNVIFTADKKTGAVTGIKGIDNDMSFGLCGVRNYGFHSIEMGLIRVVDKNTAECLENISKEVLDYRLNDILEKNEREALWKRVQIMKEWVRSDKVEKISTDEWGNKKWDELALSCDKGVLKGRNRNLFGKVVNIIMPSGFMYEHNDSKVEEFIEEGKTFISNFEERNRELGERNNQMLNNNMASMSRVR